MKFLPLSLALLLAACGPTGSGPEAVCAREVNADPEVQRIRMIGSANTAMAMRLDDDLQAAQTRVRVQCLRRLGVLEPGGGVQPVMRSRSLFDGIR